MAERTLNELIALELGWFPPWSPERERRMETEPLLSGRASYWLAPGPEKNLLPPPLYDTDWAATGVLVATCEEIHIHATKCSPACSGDYSTVSLSRNGCSGSAQRHSLQKAIAEAWYAAKEAERE